MMFYIRLARELGVTLSRLLYEESSKNINRWMAYLEIEDEIQQEKQKEEAKKKDRERNASLKAHLTILGERAHGKGKIQG